MYKDNLKLYKHDNPMLKYFFCRKYRLLMAYLMTWQDQQTFIIVIKHEYMETVSLNTAQSSLNSQFEYRTVVSKQSV